MAQGQSIKPSKLTEVKPIEKQKYQPKPGDFLISGLSAATGSITATTTFNYLNAIYGLGIWWSLLLPFTLLVGACAGAGGYLMRQNRYSRLLPIAIALAVLAVLTYLAFDYPGSDSVYLWLTLLLLFICTFSIVFAAAMLVMGIRQRKVWVVLSSTLLVVVAIGGVLIGLMNDQLQRNADAALRHSFSADNYVIKKDYDAAIREYSVATQLNPYYPGYYVERARAYAAKGDLDSAITDYIQVATMKPNDPANSFNRIDAHAEIGDLYVQQGKYNLAFDNYNEAIRLAQAASGTGVDLLVPGYYARRGDAYAGLGNYDAAMADYDQAIAASSNEVGAYYGRGLIYKARGEKDKAIADFKQVLANPLIRPDLQDKARQQLQQLGVQ